MGSFEEQLDVFDAFVFTGDALISEENREIFREYLERWGNELDEMEEECGGLNDYDDEEE